MARRVVTRNIRPFTAIEHGGIGDGEGYPATLLIEPIGEPLF